MPDTQKNSTPAILTLQANGKTGTIEGESIIAFAISDMGENKVIARTMLHGKIGPDEAMSVIRSLERAAPDAFRLSMVFFALDHANGMASAHHPDEPTDEPAEEPRADSLLN